MINYAFMIVFALEAIIKIIAMKAKYFKDNWNIFDFTVVIMTATALASSKISYFEANIETQATFIRILRILRVLRTIKRVEKL